MSCDDSSLLNESIYSCCWYEELYFKYTLNSACTLSPGSSCCCCFCFVASPSRVLVYHNILHSIPIRFDSILPIPIGFNTVQYIQIPNIQCTLRACNHSRIPRQNRRCLRVWKKSIYSNLMHGFSSAEDTWLIVCLYVSLLQKIVCTLHRFIADNVLRWAIAVRGIIACCAIQCAGRSTCSSSTASARCRTCSTRRPATRSRPPRHTSTYCTLQLSLFSHSVFAHLGFPISDKSVILSIANYWICLYSSISRILKRVL